MPHRLDLKSGANVIDRQLGNFRVQIQHVGLGSPEATLTANILALQHPTERLRSSGIPSTVELSIPIRDALDLAVEILRIASAAGIELPRTVSLNP
jgi:hypothetical protein